MYKQVGPECSLRNNGMQHHMANSSKNKKNGQIPKTLKQ